ncbi:MAG: efflux RND transporter periplasmic adaptor subunit [Alphaproteobacteria bacterium]|jgi:multidrug efflux system membrane fusion protein
MHQSSFKTLIISLLIFLQQSLVASEWGKAEKTEKKLFNVQVVESLATTINDSIDFSSTTEASRRIEIKSEVMTTVDQVMIKAGTLVKKGQHIIKLDDFDTNKELFDIDLLSQNEFNKVALFAPFNGILLDGHKIGGELVMPGEKVYELIDLSSLKIFGYINENEILSISLNNEVSISILGEEIEGKIDYISPISDPNTKTFEIVVKVDNKNYRYKDGLSSMISIKKGEVLAHKISPSILALGNDGALGVKVINDESKVMFKEIQVIEDTSEYMLVTGLNEKEQLIIVGQQYVSTGEEVSF